jgi:uncharacterized protein (DUF488 family)
MPRLREYRSGVATNKMYTVGYEGRAVEDFINVLKLAGVNRVVDVRKLPLSRKKGFSKTRLGSALHEAGIEYVHLKAAGNPHLEYRHDVQRCLRMYGGYIDEHPEVIDQLAKLALDTETALLCVEADPHVCHRSILVDRMQEKGVRLAIRHL